MSSVNSTPSSSPSCIYDPTSSGSCRPTGTLGPDRPFGPTSGPQRFPGSQLPTRPTGPTRPFGPGTSPGPCVFQLPTGPGSRFFKA